jgi:cell division protein FtsQ
MLPSGDTARKRAASLLRPAGGRVWEMRVNRRRVDRVPGERRRKLARTFRLVAPTLAVLALIGGGGALASRLLFVDGRLQVKEIRFHGLARLRPDDLLGAIPVRRGDPMLLVSPDAVEAALSKVGWIGGAEVRRRFADGVVEIEVRERRPAALLSMGDLYLVDERGEVFERARPGVGLDLPVVTGVDLDAYLERRPEMSQVLAGAVALAARWAEARIDARMPGLLVSEIHVDPVFGTTVVTADATEIRLGLGDLDAKLARLVRLLPALAAEPRKVVVIHLDDRRHPERVTVRFAGDGVAGGPVTASRSETTGKR